MINEKYRSTTRKREIRKNMIEKIHGENWESKVFISLWFLTLFNYISAKKNVSLVNCWFCSFQKENKKKSKKKEHF